MAAPTTQFYRTDSSRFRFAEQWRISRSLRKLARLALPQGLGRPIVPPGVEALDLPGHDAAAVLEAHSDRLRGAKGPGARIDLARLPEAVLGIMHGLCDHLVRRGVYVPLSREEVEERQALARTLPG